ncbi:hypothetical protein E4T44_03864 [Aureobasidium sp. EXF-8845]|nr:hypothetical protein E4T44_03864 [Aureobasidium sp. EXF-8845]KAI4854643.1 hypothetical protein E4T45_03910 [Aureobasidium sp. EXF-8846]
MDQYLVQLTAPTGNTAEHVATAQPAQLAGTKRKSTDSSNLPTINLDDYDVADGHPMDSCTVVRGKINRFLEAGEMKIGQFCDAIGVSGNAYRRFMAQHGKFAGEGSDVYRSAWLFFKKREMAGLKISTKKQKTAATASSSTSAASRKDAVPDISSIHLDGEESDSVEVFDSCDEIRKKIAAYLRRPKTTAAQLCRDLLAQYHTDKKPPQIQSGQLTKFRGYKGADTGNTSCVFYAAYVFFEKLRLAEEKPKSKHRLEMEEIWGGRGGFDITRGHHRG